MPAVSLPGYFNLQSFTSAGDLADQYRLYTYEPGTTTHKVVYTEATGTTAHTYTSDGAGGQYIATNARGELPAPPFVQVDGYDFTLKTNAGVTVWTRRVYGISDNSATLDAALRADLADVSTAGKGDDLIGWGAITAIVDGVLTRYSTLAAAVSGIGSSRCTVTVRDDITMAASATFPSTAILRVENGARITHTGFTLTAPRFECGRWQSLVGTGTVVLGTGGCDEIMCEWFGAVGDNSTDSFAAIQKAMDVATSSADSGRGYRVTLGAGIFKISDDVQIPNATVFQGQGRQHTVVRPTTGTTATVMITDKGNASKIFIKDMRIEAMGEANITDVIKLGYGATSPFAQAEMRNLYVAWSYAGGPAVAAGTKCINVTTNVATLTEIEAGYAARTFNEGSNSAVTTYTRCFSIAATDRDFSLVGDATLRDCEIEAPGAACIGVYCNRETLVDGLVYSQSTTATTNPYAIEINSLGHLTLVGFRHYNGGGASTLTAVVKDNRSGYPTNWGDDATTERRISAISQNIFLADGLYLKDHKRQSFKVRIVNTGGTMQHRITSINSSTAASSFADRISGASLNLANTPTGADGSTAFVSGAKIGSASTNILWLNTLSQADGRFSCTATIVFNNSTVALSVVPSPTSIDINGTTRVYLGLAFYGATSGTAYNLTTLGVGLIIDVTVEGFIN